MGSICPKVEQNHRLELESPMRRQSVITSKKDIQFNAGYFVQENRDSFLSVYLLHDSPIGIGGFAEVWLGTHRRTGDIRAIKIFKKSDISQDEIDSKSVLMEVDILKTLDHPNILKVFEYFEDSQNFYIVMEYCEGGDIFEKLHKTGTFTERYAAKVMNYLLKGLNYLHSKHVVHRDIKPENLLITNSSSFEDFNIKIIDFNIATRKQSKTLKGVFGTTDYMAPEVFTGIYDEKCDVWSCGVVLYLMMSGNLPFPSPNDEVAEMAICKGDFSFPSTLFRAVSSECKAFIKKLMTKNVNSRPTALEALKHPWLALAGNKLDKRLMSKTLTRMKNVSETTKLKEVFTTFIVSQLTKSSSLKKYEQIFYAIDADKNGVITKDELIKQLSTEMKIEQAEEQASKIFSLIDNDGSGEIDYTEFLRVALDEDFLLNKDNLKKAFMYFDKDSSNAIEKSELIEWLGAGGLIPEDIISQLMEEADTNGDGSIDLSEFEALLITKLDIDDEYD